MNSSSEQWDITACFGTLLGFYQTSKPCGNDTTTELTEFEITSMKAQKYLIGKVRTYVIQSEFLH